MISQLLKEAEAEPLKRMLTQKLPLLLKENAERGRFFTSSDVLDVGRSVFFEHPYIHVVDDAYIRKNCHHCCQPIKECDPFLVPSLLAQVEPVLCLWDGCLLLVRV